MRQKVQWNLDGVDPEAREAAKEAARRAGMTLGEWLNHTIADRAAKFGVDARPALATRHAQPENPVADTIDAVASRLNRLTRPQRPAARAAVAAPLPDYNYPEDVPGADVEAIVAAAAAESERRMRDSSLKTAQALDSVARWMERAEDRLNDTARQANERQERSTQVFGQAFNVMTRRLDDIERKISEGHQPALKPVWTALERIEKQIGKVAAGGGQVAKLEGALAGFESRLADIAERLTTMPVRRPMRREHLGDALGEIRERQREIDTGGDMRAEPSPRTSPRDDILRGLRSDMAKLASKLDTLNGGVAGGDAETLREEVARLNETMQDLAPRRTVEALEQAVRDLGSRVVDAHLGGFSPQMMEPIERLHEEVRKLVDMVGGGGESDLVHEVRGIARSIESLGDQPIDREVAGHLSQEIAQLRALVERGTEPDKLHHLAEQIGELNKQIGHLSQRQVDTLEFAALKSSVDEIRSGLRARPARGGKDAGPALDVASLIEGRLDELAQKVDAIAGGDPLGISAKLDTLAAKLDERPAVQAQVDPKLNDLLSQLVTRLDDAQRPQAEQSALDALERQVALLTEKLDRGQDGDTVAVVERVMGDLSAQIESLRTDTSQVAEEAVKRAVSDVLRTQPLSGDPAVFDQITRELVTVKTAQSAADSRTQSTLEAVHDTLDKVVSRLAQLEKDMQDEPVMPAGPALRDHPRPPSDPRAAGHQQAMPRMAEPAPRQPQDEPALDLADLSFADRPVPAAGSYEDLPLEPGSGRPAAPRGGAVPGAADAGGDTRVQSLLAAARRAAQAAQAESEAQQATKQSFTDKLRGKLPRLGETKPARSGKANAAAPEVDMPVRPTRTVSGSGLGEMLQSRRRPILLGLGAIILIVAVAQLTNGLMRGPSAPSQPSNSALMSPAVPQRAEPPARPPVNANPDVTNSIRPANRQPAPEANVVPPPTGDAPVVTAGLPPAPVVPAASPPPPPTEMPASPPVASSPAIKVSNVAAIGELPSAPALAGLRKAALAGDGLAVYELGARLAEGRDAPRDPKLAAKLFEKVAAEGLAPAQYRLAHAYEKGNGVTRDLKLAKTWYLRAAEKGNAKAMHNLAVLMADGAGEKPDFAAAANWFEKAATFGIRDSQYNLAILLARGLGVPQDLRKSYMWFAVAAAQGDTDAGKKREEVGTRMKPADLALAVADVNKFKPKTPDPLANEVILPENGFEAAAPATPAQRSKQSG